MMRAIGLVDPKIRAFLPDLGYAKQTSNEKALKLLD
jgi:hypothetical protein